MENQKLIDFIEKQPPSLRLIDFIAFIGAKPEALKDALNAQKNEVEANSLATFPIGEYFNDITESSIQNIFENSKISIERNN